MTKINIVSFIQALEHFDVSCVLGLTATATHETANFVASCFEIKNIIRDGSILPNNLRLTVSCENDKYQVISIIHAAI